MSGLVAIVASPGGEPVSETELTALIADWDAVRGGTPHRSVQGNEQVRAAALWAAPAQSSRHLTATAPSFAVSVGTVRASEALTSPHAAYLGVADGQFAIATYDHELRQVVLANDPMGMQPLYVSERPGRIYASTSAIVLARHLRRPASRLGLETFLLAGYHFGSRTHWDDVERLDPATCLCVSRERVDRHTYWRPQVDHRMSSLSLAASADLALDVSTAALAEHLGPDDYWADVTGGFDSRLMCLMLQRAGVRIVTNTRRGVVADDVVIGEEVARRAGLEWVELSLPDRWPLMLPDEVEPAVAWGDGNLDVLRLSRVLHAHRRLARRFPRLLTGGGGEHFQYYGWQSEPFNAGRSSSFDLDRWIDALGLKPIRWTDVLRRDPRPDVRADYRRRLLAWVEPYSHELNTTQLELLYAYKSTGHFGAYRAADMPVLQTELPFYFKPILSTAISMHHRHRTGHRLMRQMITRLDRHVAEIPTTRGGPAVPFTLTRAHRYLPYATVLGRKGVNKVSTAVTGSPLFPGRGSHVWEAAAHGALQSALKGTRVLDWSEMRIASLLDRDRFQSLLAAALSSDFDGAPLLGRIVTAELALRTSETALP